MDGRLVFGQIVCIFVADVVAVAVVAVDVVAVQIVVGGIAAYFEIDSID